MKKTDDIKRSKVNPTTNYPMDGHKEFCKRCLKQHDGCPATKSGAVSKDCNL